MSLFDQAINHSDSQRLDQTSTNLFDCACKVAQASLDGDKSVLETDSAQQADQRDLGAQSVQIQLDSFSAVPDLTNPNGLSPALRSFLKDGNSSFSAPNDSDISLNLDEPVITRADIDRFLKHSDSNPVLNLDAITGRMPEQEPKEFDIASLGSLSSKYQIPNNLFELEPEPQPTHQFGKLVMPRQRDNRYRLADKLPGSNNGDFVLEDFPSDFETIVERIDKIGKFNFETRRGKKVELEVLRDCGPGDYGLCITVEQ